MRGIPTSSGTTTPLLVNIVTHFSFFVLLFLPYFILLPFCLCNSLHSSRLLACPPRSRLVVPEVRVCSCPLAAEDNRACVRGRAVQSWMLQSVKRISHNGWQCVEEIRKNCNQSCRICAVWPRLAQIHKCNNHFCLLTSLIVHIHFFCFLCVCVCF